jgi:hypothetical protein
MIRRREALKEEEATIAAEWTAAIGRLSGVAGVEHLRLILPDVKPVGIGERTPALLEASDGEQWRPLDIVEAIWHERLATISEEILPAGQRTARSRADLEAAEAQVRKLVRWCATSENK